LSRYRLIAPDCVLPDQPDENRHVERIASLEGLCESLYLGWWTLQQVRGHNALEHFTRSKQLLGRLFDEGTVARVGLTLERALAVAAERPSGF